jgi:transcriptional regulator of acetoin/glycerol metabolism
LRNVLERAVLLGGSARIDLQHLRFDDGLASLATPSDSSLTLLDVERRHIELVLREENGHVERAARRLGIPRSSLYQKIKQLGLRPSPPGAEPTATEPPL